MQLNQILATWCALRVFVWGSFICTRSPQQCHSTRMDLFSQLYSQILNPRLVLLFPHLYLKILKQLKLILSFIINEPMFPIGHPSSEPGLTCATLNAAKASKWESSACTKKLGYICRRGNSTSLPPPQSKIPIQHTQNVVYYWSKSLLSKPQLIMFLSSIFVYPQSKRPASAPVTGFLMQVTVTTWREIKRCGRMPWLRATKREEIWPAYTI